MWVEFHDDGRILMEPAKNKKENSIEEIDIKDIGLEACSARIRQLVKICIYYLDNRYQGEEEEIFAKAIKEVSIQEGGIGVSTVYDKIRQCDGASTEFFRNLVEKFYRREGNELINFLQKYRGRNNKSADMEAINILNNQYKSIM